MLWAALGDVLPIAVVISMNPVAVVAAILLVHGERGSAEARRSPSAGRS